MMFLSSLLQLSSFLFLALSLFLSRYTHGFFNGKDEKVGGDSLFLWGFVKGGEKKHATRLIYFFSKRATAPSFFPPFHSLFVVFFAQEKTMNSRTLASLANAGSRSLARLLSLYNLAAKNKE